MQDLSGLGNQVAILPFFAMPEHRTTGRIGQHWTCREDTGGVSIA
jgi:hypothetical protein